MRRYLTVLFAAIIFSSLGFATSASAATRYASPAGTGAWQTCPQETPCSLTDAVGYPADDGDDVILASGEYALSSMLMINPGINLKGAGAATTTISYTANNDDAVIATYSKDVSISDVRITGHTNGFALSMLGGTLRRSIVTSTGWTACRSQNEYTLIVDTVCATSAHNAGGIYVLSAASSNEQIKLRGVTAVNTDPTGGYGVSIGAYQDASATLDAKSVIASGATADFDLFASSNPSSNITATVDHSIYDHADAFDQTSITAPGSGTNKTGAPGFSDPSTFDFSLEPESPAINAGDVDDLSSDKDVIGNPRVQGGLADIGAYERDLDGPGPPAFTSPSSGAVLSTWPTISGTAEPNTSVSLMLDGLYGAMTTADDSGNWSIGQFYMEPGAHTIVAKAGDAAHNWSDETSLSFTLLSSGSSGGGDPTGSQPGSQAPPGSSVDLTAPVLTLGKKPKSKTTSKKFKLAFSANAAGSTFRCKLDKAAYKPCASPYKKTVKVGSHKLLIVAIGANGNSSPISTVKWKVVRR